MFYQKIILVIYIFLIVLIGCELSELTLDLKEGSQCRWQKQRGLCVSIFQCLSAAIDAKNEDPPPVCWKDETGDKPPVVCCTDCSLVKDIRNFVFDKRLGVFEKSRLKSDRYCIKMLHEIDSPCKRRTEVSIYKMVTDHDGEQCSTMRRLTKQRKIFYAPYAWKETLIHLAMLGYGTVEVGLRWLCGGSLISDRFVLTAAYCVDYPIIGRVSQIGVGEQQGSFEHWHQYRVIEAIIYPHYNPPSMYHDIALLKTEMPVLFHFWVMPACLPHREDTPNTTAMAAAIGTYSSEKNGVTGSYFIINDNLASILAIKRDSGLIWSRRLNQHYCDFKIPGIDVLRFKKCYYIKVQLEKFSIKACKALYPPSTTLRDGFDPNTQLCYGYRNRKGIPCGTDRGAPLQKKHPKYPCGINVIGVTSFERSCKYKVGFGLYTNVSYYNSWIESIVWPEKLE